VLGGSRPGYYAWTKRPACQRAIQDAEVLEQIHTDPHPQPGRKRVARPMRSAGLVGCHRRRGRGLTRRDPQAAPAPDLVQRAFTADAPDRLWTAAITSIPTWSGWRYLAVVGTASAAG
jgi:putative transposase